jgi:cytochrome P450
MRCFPTAGVGGIARLVGSLVVASARGRDRVSVIHHWVRTESDGQDAVIVNLLVKKLLLVTGPGLSAHVLANAPNADTFTTGNLKRKGMAFLAPNALTISDGEDWLDRRDFNEKVLCTGRPHDLRDTMLRHVNDAFVAPLGSTGDVHERMAEVMTKVVVGGSAPGKLPDDVDALIGVVQNPLKRTALGWWYARRRGRFYDVVDRRWNDAPDDTLVGRARQFGSASKETTEQIPHWMFTFTGSATDLLSRTLAIVASRPDVQANIAAEVLECGALDDAHTIDALDYTEACLRETGRLFPPVTTTFHVAPNGGEFDGREIPAGMEIVHFFPLQSRDDGDPTADDFRPERWIGDHAPDSDLFLSGARTCPGEDMILFICKAALAQVSGSLTAGTPKLALDPLPRSFPVKNVTLRP